MNRERLYNLLPAIYRIRDEQQDGVLRALLGIIEQELDIVESDIENLYENWFIETCDEWVVPYIGDLLDVKLYAESNRNYGQEQRAYIANTLAYRSRKGTLPVLEQLVSDITGWRARVTEYFKFLATTQNIKQIRPSSVTFDMRSVNQPQQFGTSFERNTARSLDIRRRGGYNLSSIGISIWRLKTYPIERASARVVKVADKKLNGRLYTFSPLGNDIALFNQPLTEAEITTIAKDINLPTILYRSKLSAELDALRAEKTLEDEGYFHNRESPVFQIFVDGKYIQPKSIFIRNLSDWDKENFSLPTNSNNQVIVDPELGRLAITNELSPENVEVSYSYAFSGNIGAGSYDRSESIFDSVNKSDSRIIWNIQQDISDNIPENPLLTTAKQWNKDVDTWQKCEDRIYIPLQRVIMVPDEGNTLEKNYNSPQFQPGILTGLKVIADKEKNDITITPGIAIDARGQRINFNINYRFSLKTYPNQTLSLFIAYKDASHQPKWEIIIIPDTPSLPLSPSPLPLTLTRLTLGEKGKILEVDNSDRLEFQPGVVSGLNVTLVDSKETLLTVTSGKAVNSKGKLIELKNNTPISQQFLHNQYCQQWLLYITSKAKLEVVPDAEMGIIFIKDNRTYKGNITINIPAEKHLQIIAADEQRPHLQGNLSITGVASNKTDPGELTLNGLLVEGQVNILPGNLKRVKIISSSIVPNSTNLAKNIAINVEKIEEELELEDSDNDGNFAFLISIVYLLNLIQRIIQLGIGADKSKPRNNLIRLFQIALQQINRFCDFLQASINQCPTHELPDENNEDESETFCDKLIPAPKPPSELDNDNLSIIINQSICGAINLADTVPYLEITDSIIDKNVESSESAINANGTNSYIQKTTIFGITRVRSLEAENTIFTEKVSVLRRQEGCLRFCYLPDGSLTPRRYRCQPDLALEKLRSELKVKHLPEPITSIITSNEKIFAGTAGNGIFCFNNNQWEAAKNLTDKYITCMTASNNIIVAGSTDGEIYRSTDENCENFQLSNKGFKDKEKDNDNVNTNITALSAYTFSEINYIIAGTGGNGIYRSSNNGDSWEEVNGKLKNLHITALAVDTKNTRIFVGTLAAGIFYSKNNDNQWLSNNRGLTNPHITALTINENTGEIFAGTAGGGIYRWDNEFKIWRQINTGLTNTDITALIAYPQPGQGNIIKSEGGKIIGDNTAFTKKIAKGSKITITGETRTVTGIESDNILKVDVAFSSNITPESNYNINYLLAGTSGGNIFGSADNGNSWKLLNTNSTYSDITAFAVKNDNGKKVVFAGTTVGNILESQDDGNSWLSANSGLLYVEEKLLTLTSLQPSLTSTVYGHHAYAQLSKLCVDEIRKGAEDGSEMGVFNYLKQPQREASLTESLKEYLRFGIEAGIVYKT